jgi:hypothetical protein
MRATALPDAVSASGADPVEEFIEVCCAAGFHTIHVDQNFSASAREE